MCGFLGEISTELSSKENFKNLLDLSINRGPDQQGFWNDDICQLGFNRLSILDLSENGKQPLLSPSGKFAMVFNGEVYNYKELQLKYTIKDENLRSSSDTEILAHLLEKISIAEFAKELNGMFAIAIWDIQNKELYLIRDFAGIKPLFYGIHKDGIVFASQFDQIFKHNAFSNKKMRPEIMKEYFGLGYMHAPNTVFENIFQIEPGQIISWNFESKEISNKKFYFNWNTSNELNETDENSISKFQTIFSKVIKNQLNADVPIATFLSGGIDSPLVTAFSLKQNPKIQAYTISVDDKELNEADVAKEIATQLGANQIIKHINTNEILNSINEHFQELSEPFGDYSSLPTYIISKKAKQFASVMLSGDGGDELFWGYPRFLRSIQYINWFKYSLFFRKLIFPFLRKINKNTSSAIDVFNKFEEWILYKQIHFSNIDKFIPNTKFSDELIQCYKFDEKINKTNGLNYLKKNEFYGHMQRTLRKVDLMSMANSLEVRVPFLDNNIIQFSNSLNPKFGISHRTPKIILRKTLAKFIDKKVINLPKKGFSVPLENWLKNELKEDVLETILNKPFYGEEFIDKKYLKEIISNFYDNNKGNTWGIWHLYAWQKWVLKYNINNT